MVQKWVSRHQTQEFLTESSSQDPAKANSLCLGTGDTLVITRILALHLPRRARKKGIARRSTLIAVFFFCDCCDEMWISRIRDS